MMENGVASQPTSVVEKVNEVVQPQGWIEKIKAHKDDLIEIGIYAGVGFLCGFLFKRFGTYFIAFAVGIGVLLLMQQVDLVTFSVNWAKIQSFFGVTTLPVTDGSAFFTTLWEWIKANVRPVLSFSVGFLIGFNVA